MQLKTNGPNPLVADNLTTVYIMSKKWAEANNATKPQDFKNKEENFAVRNANGTGPFVLVSREPDVKTVVKRNDAYWGRGEVPLEITELTLTTIKQDATRVAALLSGEVDVVQDVPVQDIERLKASPNLRVTEGPENRSIFFGFDVGSKELASSDVKGKNPFADVRVRQAVNMRDQPAGDPARRDARPVGAGRLDRRRRSSTATRRSSTTSGQPDIAKAKGLLAAAGYPNGFSVSLHCPNDRYLNDEAICQAAVGMLGQIGIKINLVSQSKSLHFPTLQNLKSDFYLLGWGVPTYDSDYIFSYLYHTRERHLRRLERDALLESGARQADPEPFERDRYRQAQRDDRADLGQAARRAGLRRDPPPDAGARHEERHRRAGPARQHHLLQARRVQEVVIDCRARCPRLASQPEGRGTCGLLRGRLGVEDDGSRATASSHMIAYILRSLAQAVMVMLAVALLAFSMFRFVGDPVANMVGQEASVAGARRACRAARPQRPVPDPVRELRPRHDARRVRHVVPPGPPGEDLLRERVPATVELALLSSAVRARVRDRARRLHGDQPARHPGQCGDVALADRREPADVPDRHRADLSVRRRTALAALVRARRCDQVRLVVDRPADRDRAASR